MKMSQGNPSSRSHAPAMVAMAAPKLWPVVMMLKSGWLSRADFTRFVTVGCMLSNEVAKPPWIMQPSQRCVSVVIASRLQTTSVVDRHSENFEA